MLTSPPTRPRSSTGFNPHPAFRPGDALGMMMGMSAIRCFNPHPAFRPGDADHAGAHRQGQGGFNPHPAFRPGDARGRRPAYPADRRVSIRTRPFGRVMRTRAPPAARSRTRFNPHPAFRPGDAWPANLIHDGSEVSIRTRPFGRVMRWRACAAASPATSFNPHPAFRPGDALPILMSVCINGGFNPHPAFRPGDAPVLCHGVKRSGVSIRTRPFGRVMHKQTQRLPTSPEVSIRTRPFGRVMRPYRRRHDWSYRGFNPHPAFRPGDA